MSTVTEREAQIEALWTYEVAIEKVLKRSVKKGYITQEEADEFSEKLFAQLNTDNIPGFHSSPFGEKMRMEDICVNPYVSLTEIARERKSSSPSYLIQSWLRSTTTIEYLRMWEKIYNPKFQDYACDQLIETVHKTGRHFICLNILFPRCYTGSIEGSHTPRWTRKKSSSGTYHVMLRDQPLNHFERW